MLMFLINQEGVSLSITITQNGHTTLSIMTVSISTLGMMTITIITICMMTFAIKTLGMIKICITNNITPHPS